MRGILCFLLVGLAGSCAPAVRQQASVPRDAPAAHDATARSPLLPNVHRLSESIVSGGVPAGDAAFAQLASMGVRTVISVDGAVPDTAAARRHGIRYVHIPITYASVTRAQQLEIARAVRDLPGPVYVHCHHGKHRSPAAVAAAAVTLGLISPETGVAFMRRAGTAPTYEGLYACVESGGPASSAQLNSAPADFPEVCRPHGMIAAMVESEAAYGFLAEIRAAGWRTPKDHPDLVPAAEAGRLTESLRIAGESARVRALGEDFAHRLQDAIAIASALEAGIVAGAPRTQIEPLWNQIAASCKDCHAAYRDRP